MKAASRLEGIQEYYFSQKLREIEQLNRSGDAVINLGIGSPDLPPHPDVIHVLHEESSKYNAHAYQGYKGVGLLRESVAAWYAQWYGVQLDPESEILPLMGSKEGIMHICMAFLDSGDKALVPDPGYPTYSAAVKLAGAVCVPYHLNEKNNWFPDLEAIEQEDLANVKIMWVNYPHMPTGALAGKNDFLKLVSFGKKHNILICHDNPYSFILNQEPCSILAVPGARETAVELNSLSKSHNMAGWRIGMLCGAKENIDTVIRFKSNMDSGMFLPVQLAASRALSLGPEWFGYLNEVYRKRKNRMLGLLDSLHCIYSKSQGGLFVWAKIPSRYTDCFHMTDDILGKARVFLTPGGIFGSRGNAFIRVSLCSPEEKILEAQKRIEENF